MVIDAVVAAGMLAVLVGFAALGHPHHPHEAHRATLYLLAPFASLPLAVRRRWPVTVFAIVLAAAVAFGVLGSVVSTVTGATYALYMVAVRADWKLSLLALLAAEAGIAVEFALTTRSISNPVNGAFTGLVQLTVWIIGDGMRRHRAYAARLRDRSIRQALAEQRLQIARELHDVIAHALSVVAVQAGVGGHLVATRPDEAAKSLSAIEATARSALSETRYLLSALHDDDDEQASLVSAPGIGNISALVKQMADAGQPVTLHVKGQPRPLSPGLELSAYRVVQEALTNVVRHAGLQAAARVLIRYEDDGGVAVEVTDDGPGSPGAGSSGPKPETAGCGYGLSGMRERVRLLGGEFRAGPRPEGGYQVMARLPARDGAG
jgi:signal transduction histidine kinase